MQKQLLSSVLVVLFICFVAARTPAGSSPQCGAYTPANWYNDGETDVVTAEFGSPLGFMGTPYFFGCTPSSVSVEGEDTTISFTYFAAPAPNNVLVQHSDCERSGEFCGTYTMDYDASQGGGKLAVISTVNSQIFRGVVTNETFTSKDYQIESFVALNFPTGEYDVIGELETDSKVVRHSRRAASRIAQFSKLFGLPTFDAQSDYRVEVDFAYFPDSNNIRQEIVTVNITGQIQKMVVDFSYAFNPSGDITQIYETEEGGSSIRTHIVYTPSGEISQICVDNCGAYYNTFSYDSNGRLVGENRNGTELSFTYNAQGQIASSTDGTSTLIFNY